MIAEHDLTTPEGRAILYRHLRQMEPTSDIYVIAAPEAGRPISRSKFNVILDDLLIGARVGGASSDTLNWNEFLVVLPDEDTIRSYKISPEALN